MPRSFEEEMKFLERVSPYCFRIKKDFVPNMKVSNFLETICENHWCS